MFLTGTTYNNCNIGLVVVEARFTAWLSSYSDWYACAYSIQAACIRLSYITFISWPMVDINY